MARRKVNTQGNNPDTAKKTKKTENVLQKKLP